MQLSGKGVVQNHFLTMVHRPWVTFLYNIQNKILDKVGLPGEFQDVYGF